MRAIADDIESTGTTIMCSCRQLKYQRPWQLAFHHWKCIVAADIFSAQEKAKMDLERDQMSLEHQKCKLRHEKRLFENLKEGYPVQAPGPQVSAKIAGRTKTFLMESI